MDNMVEGKSTKRQLIIVFISVILTSVLTVPATLYITSRQQPKLLLSFASAEIIADENSRAVVTKFLIRNEGGSPATSISLPLLVGYYRERPFIALSPQSVKSSIYVEYPFAKITIIKLSPNENVVITIAGFLSASLSKENLDKLILSGLIPSIAGHVHSDQVVATSSNFVSMKKILKEEIKNGIVYSRFIATGLKDPESGEIDFTCFEKIDVKLRKNIFKGELELGRYNEYVFEMPQILLHPQLISEGKTNYFGRDIDRIILTGKKSGTIVMSSLDLLTSYFEGYEAEPLYIEVAITSNDKHSVNNN